MRHQLEEVIRSKDTFADPQELKIIEEKFQQRDAVIGQMQQQERDMSMGFQKKTEENRQLAELVQDMERRMKKAQASSKSNLRFKRDIKDKEREAHKMRKDMIDLKSANDELMRQNKELKNSNTTNKPRVNSATRYNQSQSQPSAAIQFENKKLASDVDTFKKQNETLKRKIDTQKNQLADKDEELAIATSDKVRFKELSEGYMNEIARLELQLEAADVKPKSKLSQRPKDTVMRDQSHSLSNIHAQRLKSVEPKQLTQAITMLKLLLQKKELVSDSMAPLLFDEASYDPTSEITINELKQKFQELGF